MDLTPFGICELVWHCHKNLIFLCYHLLKDGPFHFEHYCRYGCLDYTYWDTRVFLVRVQESIGSPDIFIFQYVLRIQRFPVTISRFLIYQILLLFFVEWLQVAWQKLLMVLPPDTSVTAEHLLQPEGTEWKDEWIAHMTTGVPLLPAIQYSVCVSRNSWIVCAWTMYVSLSIKWNIQSRGELLSWFPVKGDAQYLSRAVIYIQCRTRIAPCARYLTPAPSF